MRSGTEQAKLAEYPANYSIPSPQSSTAFLQSCSLRNPSGSHVSPVRGDGNKYGFAGCLSCSSTRSFTVSAGISTVRMELGVFSVLMTNFPFCRATLLLIESVRFCTSKFSHRRASSSPRRRPVSAPDTSARESRALLPRSGMGRSMLQA